MAFDLPSMKSLIAFDAVARHRSIVKAADEMALTSSALSKQIQSLETQLGTRLFIRSTRRIELTEQGQRFAGTVKTSLQGLRDAVGDMVAQPRDNVLRLAASTGFTSYSLVPRLAEFKARHAEISFSFSNHNGGAMPNFDVEPIDAAVLLLCDAQVPEDIDIDPIFQGCYLAPICAASLLPNGQPFSSVEQLGQHTWLKNRGFPTMWDYWLTQAGMPGFEPREVCWFDDGPSMFEAAAAGMGIAISGGATKGPVLPNRLVQAHSLRAYTDIANYFLVYPTRSARKPGFRKFRQWLLALYNPGYLRSA